jgi:N-acetyl-anhydromuramyl-L-alanine amidase AmpD
MLYEISEYGNFTSEQKEDNKSQIILVHTGRLAENYLQSLKFRYNGKLNRIPNYVITRNGNILKLLNDGEYTDFFNNKHVNKNSIVICLENLGWLQKEPLKDYYVNWIGDIYKGVVYEKKWRDYYFWQPYTTLQVEATALLCKKLFKEMSIKNHLIGHNTKINGVEKFEGIVTRSNYNQNYTDLNPSFDFELFLKNIEDEQFT